MMSRSNDFYTFSCDFETAETTRKFNLYFYPRDKSLELYDISMRRIILKRTITEYTLNDFYVGAKLSIFGRKIIIRGFDQTTEQKLSKISQRTFFMIMPEAKQFIGEIISTLERKNLFIKHLKSLKLSSLTAVQFLNQRKTTEDMVSALMDNLTSGVVTVMEVTGENSYEILKQISGPDNYDDARSNYPISFRALYGFDDIRCGVLLSSDFKMNMQDLDYFFPQVDNDKLKVQAKFLKSTLCIIKPHAIKEANIGGIIKMIFENGFSITAMKMLHLSRAQCESFYEIYKGVVDDYTSMVLQLQSGICLAMEIQGSDERTQTSFRALCGPIDPAVAKILRPKTIRANFGTDKVLNAVHCTDLSEDNLLELEFIFKDLN